MLTLMLTLCVFGRLPPQAPALPPQAPTFEDVCCCSGTCPCGNACPLGGCCGAACPCAARIEGPKHGDVRADGYTWDANGKFWWKTLGVVQVNGLGYVQPHVQTQQVIAAPIVSTPVTCAGGG